ncbi:MAG TPA: thioredoxin domain-containing protein [Candidatus Solibacter sp.]|nr:thioredoxin domain-containing protein [Candidatus Solibacter sp.]
MSGRLLLGLLAITIAASAEQPLVEGRTESKVRVLIYEDLQCPDCAAFRRMMDDQILPRYGERVAFVHRDFPLAKHIWARKAAIAARYFAGVKPELALEYRRRTMAAIRETQAGNFNEKLSAFARDNGIDPAEAVAALDDHRLAALVERDFQDGVARGVAKTPTVFVGGKPFIEHFTFEEISQSIEDALAGR